MLFTLAVVATMAATPDVVSGDSLSTAALLRPTAAHVALTTPLSAPARGVTLFDVDSRVHASGFGLAAQATSGDDASTDAPQLIEYSDAYFTRLTIHRWASYLTLPLFVSEYVVGQKLMNQGESGNLRGIHRVLAGSIAGLFAVNTVTGGLNAIEAWKDPEGRTRRTLHSALMLLADAGFVLTASMANEREREGGQVYAVSNTRHKRMAVASMSTALLGYLIMLPIFGNN